VTVPINRGGKMCWDTCRMCYNNCSWPYLVGFAAILIILFMYLFTKLIDVVILVSVIVGVFLLCTGYWYFSTPKTTNKPVGPQVLYHNNNGGAVHHSGTGNRNNYKAIEEQSLISESNDII